jgi:hypothetical protein
MIMRERWTCRCVRGAERGEEWKLMEKHEKVYEITVLVKGNKVFDGIGRHKPSRNVPPLNNYTSRL